MNDFSLFFFAILKCFVTTGLVVSVPLAIYCEFLLRGSRGRQLAKRVYATSLPRKSERRVA